MKSIQQNNTALYFFVTSFCTLLYGLFILLSGNDKKISLKLQEENLTIDKFELTILFKIGLLVLSIGYFVAYKLKMPLIQILTKLHTFITIGSVAISLIVSLLLPPQFVQETCFWLVVIALAAQLLFVVNMISGVVKRSRNAVTLNW